MTENTYDGLRTFIELCRQHGELKDIDGADWNLEIGTLTEATAELLKEPPAILFDKVPGYEPGYRVLSLPIATFKRTALALGIPPDLPKNEMNRAAADKFKQSTPIPPVEVETGPVMENVFTGDDVDVTRFPVLWAHENDGGRYIGTGDTVINKDPDSGFINMGTYRIQVHEPNLLGIWITQSQQGRKICQSYWDRGEACPVVATFGGDPLVFMSSYTRVPWGTSELDVAGGVRGEPIEVIKGPITGLPIPANAEIAIEGEIPPPAEQSHKEGPFGEWTGYYAASTKSHGDDVPVIRVKALYHRDNPILLNMAPQWPGANIHSLRLENPALWDQLEASGIPGIVDLHVHNFMFIVVSIKQQYAGHAQQTGNAVVGASSVARTGRFVVIVDEDIDPSNLEEVIWAMYSRCDPAEDLQILKNCWAINLDPRMPPEQRRDGPWNNNRAVFYAVRPWAWKDEFPKPNRVSRDLFQKVANKYKDEFGFPSL